MMFETSRRFELFETHRVPYRAAIEPAAHGDAVRLEVVRLAGANDRALFYPSWISTSNKARAFRLGEATRLFGHVAPDDVMEKLLAEAMPGHWEPSPTTSDADDGLTAPIWRHGGGSVALPFDPDEVTLTLLSEAYHDVGDTHLAVRLGRVGRQFYYRMRPLLFPATRVWVRRVFARVQGSAAFPRWPLETSLHDFQELVLSKIAVMAGGPVPRVASWPDGHQWALVLTHDVETAIGYTHVDLMRGVERDAGFRSSWNFVPKRYTTDDAVVRDLAAEGFEVGVHGLYHDGRDLGKLEVLKERLPEIRSYAERWNAVGFRSPSTHRRWEWMPMLGFDYDMSYSDTAPYEPQPGGCCSWLPFFIDTLVEIPITLPQDHTLFVVLGEADEASWVSKTESIRDRGGMAHMLTHPDYMIDPERLGAYRRFLERYESDPTVWKALPRDVSDWWRRRASSRLVASEGGWRIVGPAAHEGEVTFVGSDGSNT
jgi:hypothetical protein